MILSSFKGKKAIAATRNNKVKIADWEAIEELSVSVKKR